jgi:cardiolipin synthase
MKSYPVNKMVPLFDQQEEWNFRMRMVREAQQFIYVSTYFLQYDRYGREYVNALIDACKRGVSVTLIIDAFGQMLATALMTPEEIKTVKHALEELEGNNANVVFYRCASPLKKVLGSGQHIKIQLTEEGVGLFSSGNISATSYDKWREFTVYVEGVIVIALLNELANMGVSIERAHAEIIESVCRVQGVGTQTIGYISYNPTKDPHLLNPLQLCYPNPITDYLVKIFSEAQKTISLTSLYFKPIPSLLNALVEAARRGVRVEIFHSHREALGPSMVPWMPSYHLYPQLLDAGIDIYENLRGEHSKIILIDCETVFFGSYNLEYAAHDRLAEAMMLSCDGEFVKSIDALFSRLRMTEDNIKVDNTTLTALPAAIKRKAKYMKAFSRWL